MGARPNKLPRIVPEKMTEEEAQYVWKNRKGKVIYTPVYEIFTDNFFDTIVQEAGMDTAFANFASTAIYEKYMLNAAQFAAAKSVAENELLRKAAAMYEGDKTKGYHKYLPEAREICKRSQDTWLRVEYDTNRGNAVAAAQFGRYVSVKDLYPYWVYKGVMDARERPDHVALEGKVFLIGDPYGDSVFPKNDWNCRCDGINADGRYLDDKGIRAQSEAQSKALLEKYVDPQFRFNPYNQGTLPKDGHSYFEAMGSANEGDFNLFNLPPGRDQPKGDMEGFAATDLHKVVNYVHKWGKTHHVNANGELIFQSPGRYTNVIWTANSLHEVSKHQRGIENLPSTIAHPDEVWGSWGDHKQQVSKRVYLKFGKTCYLVITTDGVIDDAFAVSPTAADKYRKGVII